LIHANADRVNDAAGLDALVVAAYEAHHAEVFAFLVRATRDRSLAEELLRETFLGLTSEADGRFQSSQVRGSLYRIAATLVTSRTPPRAAGHRWPGRPRRAGRGPSVASTPDDRGPLSGPTTDTQRALDGLSVEARVALLLSAEGFAGNDIATAIGRPTSATRTLLCLARTRVRVRRRLFAAVDR
jgi:DNA-directed RNA polymerase specialized sigma24 family protein